MRSPSRLAVRRNSGSTATQVLIGISILLLAVLMLGGCAVLFLGAARVSAPVTITTGTSVAVPMPPPPVVGPSLDLEVDANEADASADGAAGESEEDAGPL